jgi:hypothetical protein
MKARSSHRRALTDPLKMRGYLEFVLRDALTGEIVQRGKKENTVTCTGRGWALAKLTGGSSNAGVLTALAIGASSTAPASNQSALASYQTIRALGTTALTTATDSACTFTGACSFASNETWTNASQIGEFALYNSSATGGGGTMFNRLNTGTYINFSTSNTLAITVTITN